MGGGFQPKSPTGSGASVNNKLETLRAWSVNTYKCTRQLLSERFGRGSKTIDLELEAQIEQLKDTQKKYANILRLARAMTHHFYNVMQTQRQLGDAFSEMSQKNPELQDEFAYNSETQKVLHKNGEALFGELNVAVRDTLPGLIGKGQQWVRSADVFLELTKPGQFLQTDLGGGVLLNRAIFSTCWHTHFRVSQCGHSEVYGA